MLLRNSHCSDDHVVVSNTYIFLALFTLSLPCLIGFLAAIVNIVAPK